MLFIDDRQLYATNNNQLDSLINIVMICSQDISMSLELDKYSVLEMKRGRKVYISEIEISDEESMKKADNISYKYLGVLQVDKSHNDWMKSQTRERGMYGV